MTDVPDRELGVRGHRRSPAWTKVDHGLYRIADVDDPWRAEVAAWSLLLPPSAAFTHVTSARRRGWWLPPLPDDLPTFIAMAATEVRPRRGGLVVARHATAPAREPVDGVWVGTPAETLLACARHLGLLDLVVLIDAALHLEQAQLPQLVEVAGHRRRGAPLLRRALPLADARSESAYETLLRMLHVACGVDVEPQRELFDGDGAFVARGDLWLVGTSMLHEYDGADHLERRRQRADLRRARGIGNSDWSRRGYTSVEVINRSITILRDCDLILGRPHDPRRLQRWYALLRESCFTAAGQARLRTRLGLDAPAQGEPPGQR